MIVAWTLENKNDVRNKKRLEIILEYSSMSSRCLKWG
jgi:hypothetical protein